jgi:hypothetical protein
VKAEQSNSITDMVALPSQDQALQTTIMPVIPVTAQALTSLHKVNKQDICAVKINDAGKQRLQRRVGKLKSAA